MSNNEEWKEVSLKKELGLISGIGLIVGTIIGSGIFVSPGGVLSQSGSVFSCLLVWATCGFVSLLGAMSYVELGTMIPESGAEYPYLFRGLGPLCGYLYSWMSVLVLRPAQSAIICQTFALYTVRLFVDDPEETQLMQTLVAIAALVVICIINCLSVPLATFVQNSLTFAKLVAVAIIILGGVYQMFTGDISTLGTGFEQVPGTEFTVGSVAVAFYSGLWSYDGWNQLNFVTEEIKNPNKNLPRAILIGLPMVTLLYLLVNVAYLIVIPLDELIDGDTVVAVAFVRHLLSEQTDSWVYTTAPFVMTAFVAMSTFGAANGSLFTSARLSFAAGRNGHLPELLSYVQNRTVTPIPSLVFISAIAVVMSCFSDIATLIDFFSITAWLFYGSCFLSLLILRYTAKELERPFRVWAVVPIIATLLSVYFVFAPVINAVIAGESIAMYVVVFGFLLSGILFYVPLVAFRWRVPGISALNNFLLRTCNMSHGHKDEELQIN